MEENTEKAIENFLRKDDVHLADHFMLIFQHWRWILLAVIFSFLFAFAFIRFQTPKYQVSATLMLKDNDKGSGTAEAEVFKELGLGQSASTMEDEMEVFKSRSIMYRVVKNLDLDYSYFSQGNPVYHEKYNNFPLSIEVFPSDSIAFDDYSNSFEIEVLSHDQFILGDKNKEINEANHSFHEDIPFSWGYIRINKTTFLANNPFRENFESINYRSKM